MRQWNTKYAYDNDVINACANVFRIVEFRYSHVTCFPGEEHAKNEQKTFVDVDDGDPVTLICIRTIVVYFPYYNVLVWYRLKYRRVQFMISYSRKTRDLFEISSFGNSTNSDISANARIRR